MTTDQKPEPPVVDLDALDRYYADADMRRWVANTSVHESTTFGNVRAFVQVSAGSAMGPPILRLEVGQDEIQSALNNARCIEHLHNSWPAASAEIRSLRSRVESRTMDLAALEGTNSANEGALRIQLERLQEQEAELRTLRARVAELEVPDCEADLILTMSEAELDSEIRAVGIDHAELDKTAGHVAKWATECSKLRARVGELEEKAAGYLHAFKDGCERSIEAVDALTVRAESAEARVKELEASIARIHSFAGRGDGHGSLAATEACLADTFTMLRIDYDNAAKEAEADAARITDLESQLAELHRATEESSFLDLKDRLTTVIDEAFGMQPSMTGDELVSFLEQRLFRDRQAHNELESQLAAAREEQGLEAKGG